MPSTIVVPLDKSELSESALPVARAFARDSGASLTLLTVVDVSSEFTAWMLDSSVSDDFEQEKRTAAVYLDEIAARQEGLTVETVVLTGRPEKEILEFLDQAPDPLVVMSSHGRSGFNRLVVGSVAGRIVHGATCPVVVVRGSETTLSGAIDKILVPLDGSEFAENALEVAQQALASRQLQIHLVRVPESVTWAASPEAGAYAYYEVIDTYMEAMKEEAQAYLAAVAAKLEERGHTVTWEVRTGMVSEEIAAAADEQQVDLVVIATHGRTGFRRVVMGSVAERVLREANAPLMMVRPQDD
jgi:nucleotide-binding universal stress UspA family protein